MREETCAMSRRVTSGLVLLMVVLGLFLAQPVVASLDVPCVHEGELACTDDPFEPQPIPACCEPSPIGPGGSFETMSVTGTGGIVLASFDGIPHWLIARDGSGACVGIEFGFVEFPTREGEVYELTIKAHDGWWCGPYTLVIVEGECPIGSLPYCVDDCTCGTGSNNDDVPDCPAVEELLAEAVREVGGAEREEYCTIQAAVDAASSGDVILLHDGEYLENVVVSAKNVEIRACTDAAVTWRPETPEPVLTVSETERLEVSGVTFEGRDFGLERPVEGGAILAENSGLVVSGCGFSGFRVQGAGGAIRGSELSHCELRRCEFTANSAEVGGAVSLWRCAQEGGQEVVMAECNFLWNEVPLSGHEHHRGGAIDLEECFGVTISESKFLGNEASMGGGVSVANSGRELDSERVSLDSCAVGKAGVNEDGQLLGNTAAAFGGGLYVLDSWVSVLESRFEGNFADVGGGLAGRGFGDLEEVPDEEISDLVLIEPELGPISDGQLSLRESWVVKNTALLAGGGLAIVGDEPYSNLIGGDVVGGLQIVMNRGVVSENVVPNRELGDGAGGGFVLGGFESLGSRLEGVRVTSNQAGTGGGGIVVAQGTLSLVVTRVEIEDVDMEVQTVISSPHFEKNIARRGDGGGLMIGSRARLAMLSGTLDDEAMVLDSNESPLGRGGGLHVDCGAKVSLLANTDFLRNAGLSGGGVSVDGAEVTLERALFEGNSATLTSTGLASFAGSGGGVAVQRSGCHQAETVVLISESTLASNRAARDGGAVFVEGSASPSSMHGLRASFAEVVFDGNTSDEGIVLDGLSDAYPSLAPAGELSAANVALVTERSEQLSLQVNRCELRGHESVDGRLSAALWVMAPTAEVESIPVTLGANSHEGNSIGLAWTGPVRVMSTGSSVSDGDFGYLAWDGAGVRSELRQVQFLGNSRGLVLRDARSDVSSGLFEENEVGVELWPTRSVLDESIWLNLTQSELATTLASPVSRGVVLHLEDAPGAVRANVDFTNLAGYHEEGSFAIAVLDSRGRLVRCPSGPHSVLARRNSWGCPGGARCGEGLGDDECSRVTGLVDFSEALGGR
ncbi:MAG: hypothetical protein AAF533_19660 [Acidobacteriota bacterium]